MSLLMDALKKAELAKRQGSSADADAAATAGFGELSLEQLPPSEPLRLEEPKAADSAPVSSYAASRSADTGSTQGDPRILRTEPDTLRAPAELVNSTVSAVELTPTDTAQALRDPQRRLEPIGANSLAQERRNAENLFAAKQGADTGDKGRKRLFAIAIGATTLSTMLAIGVYFWWQLQPRSGASLNMSAQAPRPIVPPAPASPPAQVTPAPAATPATAATTTAPAPTTDTAATGTTVSETPGTPPVPVKATVAARTAANTPEPDEDRPVRITRAPLKLHPGLAQAFESGNRGDWELAQKFYLSVLRDDPQNSDALHGMAAIALRDGKLADADRYLQRLLLANPQDTVALSALTNLYARNNPGLAETRLKTLAATQPDQAAPHIALGNLYSGQARWAEAQQSYFAAYASQPDNPDLLFNLAISLEYLNQPKLAGQYYNEALLASKRRPAAFSAAQVEERLRALQP